MKNKSIKSKVVTGVILASMVISASTGVFAADSLNVSNNKSAVQHQGRENGFQTKLDSLVAAGSITSDQETAIKEALMPQGGFKNGEHKDFFKTKLSDLVTAGTITADEQTAIETALENTKGNFKTVLDNLVTNGTLTSDKETAIENALKPEAKNGGHKDFFKTKLSDLVTA
ncbi:hypothetical protein HGI38_19190, partial [Clostridium beijerinckii]|nr:hypothetical protein [Clostridium beijerinckii]MBC2433899.1 hypothetical protein [Clostridium beijerinckii]MBC2491104.1 hypothetical protein [Clostridium beijerinckii]